MEFIEYIGIGATIVLASASAIWAVHKFHLGLNCAMKENLEAMSVKLLTQIEKSFAPLQALVSHLDKTLEVYHTESKDSIRRISHLEEDVNRVEDRLAAIEKKTAVIESQIKGRRDGDPKST